MKTNLVLTTWLTRFYEASKQNQCSSAFNTALVGFLAMQLSACGGGGGSGTGTGAASDSPVSVTISSDSAIDTSSANLSIDNVTASESAGEATFTVSLSNPFSQTITVDYATSDDTASAGTDYNKTNGTLTFLPGETSKTITVSITGDNVDEIDEKATITLSSPNNATIDDATGILTVTDDDSPPSLSIDDVEIDEGTSATFTVSLSSTSSKQIEVDYATSDGTASAGTDYQATSGTLTFLPGETSKTITVSIAQDDLPENNETTILTLSNSYNAFIEDDIGTLTINDDDISFTKVVIDTTADSARGVHVADIDGDGDLDIVSASANDRTIAWYENDGGADPTWTAVDIATTADGAQDVHVADMDNDGDLDIVSASSGDDTIAWYENKGADVNGNLAWTAADIDTSASGAYDVYVADMDNDGDLDIVSASWGDDTIAWYENDGNKADPTWTAANIATTAEGAMDVYVADMDNDGDLDIVSASFSDDTIAWYENDGAAAPTWTAIDIDNTAEGASDVHVADIDGDGHLDIVSASRNDNTIAWYKNDGDKANPTWTATNIATTAEGAMDVYVADMDNDGDLDIVSASFSDDTIAWYENDGAADPSWTAADIDTNADGAWDVYVADMDGDGDLDIVSASYSDDTIAWYENDLFS